MNCPENKKNKNPGGGGGGGGHFRRIRVIRGWREGGADGWEGAGREKGRGR